MDIIDEFRPLLESTAKQLSAYWSVQYDDLYQEGCVKLCEIEQKFPFMFEWHPGERTKYIQLAILGAMKDYIAHFHFSINVQKDSFFKGQYKTQPKVDNDSLVIDIEELIIQREARRILWKQVRDFTATLTKEEYTVFFNWLYTDNKRSMREIAKMIGKKSPQTVANIKTNLMERWQETYGTDLQSILSERTSEATFMGAVTKG